MYESTLNTAGRNIPETAERAISRSMTELAASIGDLETAARALVSRINPMIPGGSPFDRQEKLAGAQAGTSTPAPVRSDFCNDIEARTYQIRQITARLGEASERIEL